MKQLSRGSTECMLCVVLSPDQAERDAAGHHTDVVAEAMAGLPTGWFSLTTPDGRVVATLVILDYLQ